MATWQLQEAKAKFSELVDKAEKEGAQVITRRGVETAVIVVSDGWVLFRPNESLTNPRPGDPNATTVELAEHPRNPIRST